MLLRSRSVNRPIPSASAFESFGSLLQDACRVAREGGRVGREERKFEEASRSVRERHEEREGKQVMEFLEQRRDRSLEHWEREGGREGREFEERSMSGSGWEEEEKMQSGREGREQPPRRRVERREREGIAEGRTARRGL